MEHRIKECDDQDYDEPRPPGEQDFSKRYSALRCDQGEGATMVYEADNKKNNCHQADKTKTDTKIRYEGVLRKFQQKDERVGYSANDLPNK